MHNSKRCLGLTYTNAIHNYVVLIGFTCSDLTPTRITLSPFPEEVTPRVSSYLKWIDQINLREDGISVGHDLAVPTCTFHDLRDRKEHIATFTRIGLAIPAL